MMRLGMLLCLLLLAACGAAENAPQGGEGDAAPTTEVQGVPATLMAEATQGVLIVTRAPLPTPLEGALPVAAPGTLVASETEDPTAGMTFTTLRLFRVGGGTEAAPEPSIEIIVNGDGTYTRNGVSGVLSADRVAQINDAITAVNFFGMQGAMLGADTESISIYRYALTIQRGDLNRTLSSMDGFMPQEYIRLLGIIFEVGLRP